MLRGISREGRSLLRDLCSGMGVNLCREVSAREVGLCKVVEYIFWDKRNVACMLGIGGVQSNCKCIWADIISWNNMYVKKCFSLVYKEHKMDLS